MVWIRKTQASIRFWNSHSSSQLPPGTRPASSWKPAHRACGRPGRPDHLRAPASGQGRRAGIWWRRTSNRPSVPRRLDPAVILAGGAGKVFGKKPKPFADWIRCGPVRGPRRHPRLYGSQLATAEPCAWPAPGEVERKTATAVVWIDHTLGRAGARRSAGWTALALASGIYYLTPDIWYGTESGATELATRSGRQGPPFETTPAAATLAW